MGQVDKEEMDIPAQRAKCQAFAARQGWTVIDEYTELGVSGFKVSAQDRDAIQEIRQRAERQEFDVLLVFMFDRIGRRRDETPFIVEWFIENGVEVWSAEEGQQRLENDGDYLMNYIRYWTASSESKKTSMRTRSGMEQIIREGHFKGGINPYGYTLEKIGRLSKRGVERYDLVVNDFEASVVRDMFDWYANKGMGTYQIASQLTRQGIPSRSGSWLAKTVQYMLKNPVYIGILKSGKVFSEPFEQYRIVSDEVFQRAQTLLKERSKKGERHVPLSNRSKALLSGNIFCGHCGGRLIPGTSGKNRVKADGTVISTTRNRYSCYNRTRKRKECEGPSCYTAAWVDEAVMEAVSKFFAQMAGSPKEDIIDNLFEKKLEDTKIQLEQATSRLREESKELQIYEAEVIKCLTGKSKFSEELLNRLIDEKSGIVNSLKEEVSSLEAQLASGRESIQNAEIQLDYILTWTDLFDTSDLVTKKMIVSNLVDRVIVSKDYKITIQFNAAIEELSRVAA